MKNVSSLKPNDINSPKTPGGISKSLLTPCRRLGLSRNWRKSGPSPFISPLASSSTEVTEEKNVTRKRKERLLNENVEPADKSPTNENEVSSDHIDHTPSRNVEEPRKKRSKVLLKAINNTQDQNITNRKCSEKHTVKDTVTLDSITENADEVSTPVRTKSVKNKKRTSPLKRDTKQSTQEPAAIDGNITENTNLVSTPVLTKSMNIKKRSSPLKSRDTEQTLDESANVNGNTSENIEVVSTPVRTKSIKNKKRPSPLKKIDKETNKKSFEDNDESIDTGEQLNANEATYAIKERSPNDLRKECIVVIQRKIFKNIENKEAKNEEKPSEMLDSDSDDTPLISIQKQNSVKSNSKVVMEEDNDDDFIENSSKGKLYNHKDLKSPKNKLKTVKPVKTKVVKSIIENKPSQNCFDDDDDDDFDNKKTILIKKTYEKVSKPLKAKSTGSITQRDIDNLKRRIEAKKKLLLAQSLTPDTEELRSLIKKWQKGCQDALMELLELMRSKFPDKEHMDYSEMLQTLKIPPSLVGYDSENDCFNSPDDASIILGQYKDL